MRSIKNEERTSRVQKGERMYAANFHIKEHYRPVLRKLSGL